MSNLVLECKNLAKIYEQSDSKLEVLVDISLAVAAGEIISIVGQSGSGKSTLLHILSGLDKATSGEVILANHNLCHLKDSQICTLRNQNIGFVYQFHHLLPEFTALDNVLMPLMIRGKKITSEQRLLAKYLLVHLGLEKRLSHYPSQLSGGERQRVAIARAIVTRPKVIFADEPTGSLDSATGDLVFTLFLNLQREFNTSVVLVTHNLEIAKLADTEYRLHNGIMSLN